MHAPKLGDLARMTDEEIVEKHDQMVTTDRGRVEAVQIGIKYFLDELARREDRRQTAVMLDLTMRMESYTKKILYYTVVVTVATVVGLWGSVGGWWPL